VIRRPPASLLTAPAPSAARRIAMTLLDAASAARERLTKSHFLGVVLNEVPRRALGPRSAEGGGLNQLRLGIEHAIGNLDATCAEVAALRDAAPEHFRHGVDGVSRHRQSFFFFHRRAPLAPAAFMPR